MKNIHFMAGFPRSGSTLLTSIINQNPRIYATHKTHLHPSVKAFVQENPNHESVQSGYLDEIYPQVVYEMAQGFYKHIDKPTIIDKNRDWATPYSIHLAKMISENTKIIFQTRPILEILASFVTLARNNKGNYIDQNMQNEDFWSYYYRPIDDARCDWLMKSRSQIDVALFGYEISQRDEYKDIFHLIDYKDLCLDPQQELNKMYDFLGEERFSHQFEQIENNEPLNDAFVFGVPSLHWVRSKIDVLSPKPEDVLSDYVIEKYGNSMTSLVK
jgi:sulfotransferase